MFFEVSTAKGFSDYLFPESLKKEKLRRIVERNFRLFGFIPIETPIIEFDELMRPGSLEEQEDDVISDRFKLKDKAGRNLGLRYEFTFQLSRIFKENPFIKLPLKKYQIGQVFRDEPTRTGRTRQFTQCDVDIVGDPSVKADAEVLAVVCNVFNELKIDTDIKINNRALIFNIIESVEMQDKKQVLRELDKIDKIGLDEVKANLRKYASANQIVTLFKLLEKDLEFFKTNAFDGAKDVQDLLNNCRLYGIKAAFKPTLVRGLGYYTGNIFEAILPDGKTSIAGGGRYDNSVGKYLNKQVPAVGFSFSLEALMGLCPDKISKIRTESLPKVILISIEKERDTITLGKKLRKNNISCTITVSKLDKALEYADAYKIPFAIMIGEDEIKQGKFKLRDLNSGEEKLLSEKQLISRLKK